MKVKEFRLKLYPHDFYATKDFYVNVLGFSVTHEWERPNSKGVMLNAGGAILEFMWPVEEGLVDIATGSGLSLEVDDVHTLHKDLKDKVEISHPPRDNPWGDTSFGIVDPSGYRISFYTSQRQTEG